jgi:hypothetical protein
MVSSGFGQIVNEQKSATVIVSFSKLKTFVAKKRGLLNHSISKKLFDLIGHVFEALGDQSLNVDSLHFGEVRCVHLEVSCSIKGSISRAL